MSEQKTWDVNVMLSNGMIIELEPFVGTKDGAIEHASLLRDNGAAQEFDGDVINMLPAHTIQVISVKPKTLIEVIENKVEIIKP